MLDVILEEMRMKYLVVVLTGFCLIFTSPTHAEVPHLIQYQGQAVDAQKVPGANGAQGLVVVYW